MCVKKDIDGALFRAKRNAQSGNASLVRAELNFARILGNQDDGHEMVDEIKEAEHECMRLLAGVSMACAC